MESIDSLKQEGGAAQWSSWTWRSSDLYLLFHIYCLERKGARSSVAKNKHWVNGDCGCVFHDCYSLGLMGLVDPPQREAPRAYIFGRDEAEAPLVGFGDSGSRVAKTNSDKENKRFSWLLFVAVVHSSWVLRLTKIACVVVLCHWFWSFRFVQEHSVLRCGQLKITPYIGVTGVLYHSSKYRQSFGLSGRLREIYIL